MNITIFGASGGIGSRLVKKALAEGDCIVAYVRNPEKLSIQHENLKVVAGQLSDAQAIQTAISDADVVISALGPDMKGKKEDMSTPVADGHTLIIKAMDSLGKKRLITLATPTVPAPEDKKSFLFSMMRKMAPRAMPHAVRDIIKLGEVVVASDLDWTIIRILNPNVNSNDNGYKLAVGSEKWKMSVSRENIANSLYDVAKSTKYIRQMPIVFNQ